MSPSNTSCSTRGTPTRVPVPGGAPGATIDLCACSWTWSGGADLFDLRPYPAPYPALQSDCVVPVPGLIVIWAQLLLFTLLRYKNLSKALARRVWGDRAHAAAPSATPSSPAPSLSPAARRRRRAAALSQRPVQIMLVDAFVATPLCLGAVCYKLSDLHGVVLGSDVAFTVTLLVSVAMYATLWAWFQHVQFSTLTASQHMRGTSFAFAF